MKTITTMMAMAIVLSATSSQATLLAYEGFDTASANGTDVESVGVTGSGFSNYTNTNFRMDIENGLSYSDGSGNTLTATGKSAGMDAVVSGTQNLQLSFGAISSGTIYVSFLQEVSAGNSWGLLTGLQNGPVGNSSSPVAAATYRSTSSNYGILGGGIDIRTGSDSTPPALNATDLIVMEIDLDNNDMTAWLNPTDLEDVAATAADTITGSGGTIGSVDTFVLSLGSSYGAVVDEIRIGTTLTDVTPIPEPATLSLIGAFGVAVIFIRKRFMM